MDILAAVCSSILQYVHATRTALTVGVMCVVALQVTAAEFDDGAPGNSYWGAGLNWDTNTTPDDKEKVELHSGYHVLIDAAGTPSGAEAGDVEINDGATLEIQSGTFTFDKKMKLGDSSPGTVNQFGGTVSGEELEIEEFGHYQLLGGSFDLQKSLKIKTDGLLELTGDPILDVGDKLEFDSGATLEIHLVGTTPPTINIDDELKLDDKAILRLDTNSWTGAGEVTLFNAGEIKEDFAQVFVNDVLLDSSGYTIGSGSITFHSVPEPQLTLIGLAALLWMIVLARRLPLFANEATPSQEPHRVTRAPHYRNSIRRKPSQRRRRARATRKRVERSAVRTNADRPGFATGDRQPH